MHLKLICKRTVIIGTLLIWTIKLLVRPYHLLNAPFFLGIAPNLIGSFLIPFGAFWFFNDRQFLLARLFRVHTLQQLRMTCLKGFGLLLINEYLQLIPIFGRTFDPYDIAFSSIGLIISYPVFAQVLQRYPLHSPGQFS